MLIYNITFQASKADERNLLIWLQQQYIPQAMASGELSEPQLCEVLSHHDPDSTCYALQFHVADSQVLHHWYRACGAPLHEEMINLFKEQVVAFSTLMQLIEES